MLRVYKDVLEEPGTFAFSSVGLLARLPMSMLGIGIVILLGGGDHGSYGLAGLVSAVFGLSQSISAPILSRLVDRYGQAVVLRPAIILHAVGVSTLTATAVKGGPDVLLFVGAVIGGASMVSIGSLVRARWADILPQGPSLQAAFSLEAVLDELLFVVGPVLVTLLATIMFPAAGLVVALGAGIIGGTLLSLMRLTEPIPHHVEIGVKSRSRPLLIIPGVSLITSTSLLIGVIFGANDVVSVAYATAQGKPGLAGVILAMLAVGSFSSGLYYGAKTWKVGRMRQFRVGFLMLALGTALLPWAGNMYLVGGVMLLIGLSIGPLMIIGSSIIQASVPGARLTEGLTWMSTSLGFGVSVGAAGGGWAVDQYGAQSAYVTSSAAGMLALLIALVGGAVLSKRLVHLDALPTQHGDVTVRGGMSVHLPLPGGGMLGVLIHPDTDVAASTIMTEDLVTPYWPGCS